MTELAAIRVKPGYEGMFEERVAKAKPLFLAAEGCHGLDLWRSLEDPLLYRLVVEWETVEHHTVAFRQSPAFASWRELVYEYFDATPSVEHQRLVSLD